MAAAREMQRRATLPIPPRQESGGRKQDTGNQSSGNYSSGNYSSGNQSSGNRNSWDAPPRFQQARPPHAPQPLPQPSYQHFQAQPLHHRMPSQQARQNASYGRSRPQMEYPPQGHNSWQKPGGTQQAQQFQRHDPNSRNAHREEPQNRNREAPPAGMPPSSPAALSELFSLLGGLGGLGGGAPGPSPMQSAFENVPPGGEGAAEGVDSILMMVLLLLLRKENADQGLLLALMYIML